MFAANSVGPPLFIRRGICDSNERARGNIPWIYFLIWRALSVRHFPAGVPKGPLMLPGIQRCSPAGLQPCSPPGLQPYRAAALQPCRAAALQGCRAAAPPGIPWSFIKFQEKSWNFKKSHGIPRKSEDFREGARMLCLQAFWGIDGGVPKRQITPHLLYFSIPQPPSADCAKCYMASHPPLQTSPFCSWKFDT